MICNRCTYDEKIPYITFDENGICNYCHEYDIMDKEYPTGEEGWKRLKQIANKIKSESRGDLDVVVGVSGGRDSSYMLHLCKELGLKPLAAHFDNTWNSKIAVENIYEVTKALDVPLYTYVMDNREFNDLYFSAMKASIPEIDVASDIALASVHYMAAQKYGIKYIFEGHSFRTEGITPPGWVYMDAKYIESIQKQFGSVPMKTHPNLWMNKWLKWTIINRIKKIRPLYYIDYNRDKAGQLLQEKYGWKWYGGHHMENKSAAFNNHYYLPYKFDIDLRQVEFAGLVRSGQMTRDDALEKLKQQEPFDLGIIDELKKRLRMNDQEFNNIMRSPNKSYRDYETYKQTFEKMRPLFWLMYKMDLVPKSFYLKFTRKYN